LIFVGQSVHLIVVYDDCKWSYVWALTKPLLLPSREV
jgi:hypothetical protein